ncbi:hypothetical protein Vadar_031446 [Vaccinium darrowii]|uniref:Uncharacterized protein n=1 Tax=Vaccinium darrowii TaxID=229202 RepID=A0ACB7Y3M9_9ERIC|nr:hypothetical protein Vadar_031446 [Vaccinium darrowii]
MLEVLCGRRAVDTQVKEEQHSLALWAQQSIKENKLDQLIDPRSCSDSRPKGRPRMADVVVRPECALATEKQGMVPSIEEEDDFSAGGDVDEKSGENAKWDDSLALVGEGCFGKVYKGWLNEKNGSGLAIAVKKLNPKSWQGFDEWQSELFLGRFSHPNIVKLLGLCWEENNLLLVYEFIPKGSVEDHLFGRGSAVQPLPWGIRFNILTGAARGLDFLHGLEKQVIYRDFKTSNLLLDEVALKCLGLDPKAMPRMKEVVETLERLDASNEKPMDPLQHRPLLPTTQERILSYQLPQ